MKIFLRALLAIAIAGVAFLGYWAYEFCTVMQRMS